MSVTGGMPSVVVSVSKMNDYRSVIEILEDVRQHKCLSLRKVPVIMLSEWNEWFIIVLWRYERYTCNQLRLVSVVL